MLKELVGDDDGNDATGTTTDDKLMKLFATAIEQESFDIRGPLASKFNTAKANNQKLRDDYAALKGKGRQAWVAFNGGSDVKNHSRPLTPI